MPKKCKKCRWRATRTRLRGSARCANSKTPRFSLQAPLLNEVDPLLDLGRCTKKKNPFSLALSLPPSHARSRALSSLSLSSLAVSRTQGARIHLSLSWSCARDLSLLSLSRSRFLAHTKFTHAPPCTNLEEIHEEPCQSLCAYLKVLVYETLSCSRMRP